MTSLPLPPLDFLSLEPCTVDTPDFEYQKFRFFYTDGLAQIIARSGYPIRELSDGTLTKIGHNTWLLVAPSETWTVDRTRGCACKGQPIIPKDPPGPS